MAGWGAAWGAARWDAGSVGESRSVDDYRLVVVGVARALGFAAGGAGEDGVLDYAGIVEMAAAVAGGGDAD